MFLAKRLCIASLLISSLVLTSQCCYHGNLDVDTSGNLYKKEREYIEKRKKIVKKELEDFTGKEVSEDIIIGLCSGGGSNRSLFVTLGFIRGLVEIGLFKASTYMSGLSGSTWLIIAMLLRNAFFKNELSEKSTQDKDFKKFLKELKEKLQENISKNFWRSKIALEFIETAIKNLVSSHKTEYDDIWGEEVAGKQLIGDLPKWKQLTFKKIRSFLKKTDAYPFPACVAIMKDTLPSGEYEQIEVTPFSCGSRFLKGFIPTKYFGSIYENGKRIETKDEKPISSFIGILSSVFDVNDADPALQLIQFIPETDSEKSNIIEKVHKTIKKHKLGKKNFFASKIPNPTYKMEKSGYKGEFLNIADGGFAFNLAMSPLLRKKRKVKLVICCDPSSDACSRGFPELKLVKRYAKRYDLTFPSMKRYDKITPHIFLFKWDENKKTSKKMLRIFYFENTVSDSTFKMQYPQEESSKLCDTMKNMVINKKVKDAIKKEIIEMDKQS
ncbi:hypothetical protein ACFLYA_02595 [Candidatus Dependentiae bacterium]